MHEPMADGWWLMADALIVDRHFSFRTSFHIPTFFCTYVRTSTLHVHIMRLQHGEQNIIINTNSTWCHQRSSGVFSELMPVSISSSVCSLDYLHVSHREGKWSNKTTPKILSWWQWLLQISYSMHSPTFFCEFPLTTQKDCRYTIEKKHLVEIYAWIITSLKVTVSIKKRQGASVLCICILQSKNSARVSISYHQKKCSLLIFQNSSYESFHRSAIPLQSSSLEQLKSIMFVFWFRMYIYSGQINQYSHTVLNLKVPYLSY
jgi:hypothetical protein